MNSTKSQGCKRRLFRVLACWLGLPLTGICYYIVISRLGFGLPCLFRTITGLLCPGCGVTHMALCLLHGDLRGALSANAMVLIFLPILLILAIRISRRYLVSGCRRLTVCENRVVVGMIVLLLGFGVIRNFGFFS